MNNNNVTIGLYRHFKGAYYYVTGLSKNAIDNSVTVNYFNVCHPEYGSFVRPLDDWITDIDDKAVAIILRKDNVTGQRQRFERVKDLNFQLGSISTEQLIDELRRRTDSPIHELDIEGLRSNIHSKDYVVGEAYEATEDTPSGVFTLSTHDTLEQAQNYYDTHKHRTCTRVFKRTFIEV